MVLLGAAACDGGGARSLWDGSADGIQTACAPANTAPPELVCVGASDDCCPSLMGPCTGERRDLLYNYAIPTCSGGTWSCPAGKVLVDGENLRGCGDMADQFVPYPDASVPDTGFDL